MNNKHTQNSDIIPLLQFYRVSKFFKPDNPTLFDVTFDVAEGEFLYIAGTSGAGKSTLLNIINLSQTPDTGRIVFRGHDLAKLKKSAISVLRREMGIVFQNFMLVDELSVGDNIALALEVVGASPSYIQERVKSVLKEVNLSGMEKEKAGTLSGGEQQRVAIARAMATNPKLLLADEPTGSLDTYSANYVLDMLEEINEKGTTVIVATHDRMLMAARPHRTLALDDGKIVGVSQNGAFKSRPAKEDEQ